MRRQSSISSVSVILLSILAFCGLFWANLRFTRKETGGGDFASYWASAKTLLYDGATPYGELASLRSQSLIFGLAGRKGDPPSRLDLPFYTETLLLPLGVVSDYQLARAIWMSILEIALVVTIFISLQTLHWKPSPVIGAGVIFFALFSVYGLWAVTLGNAIILSALLIAGALRALRENQDELTGILLALAAFKFLTVGLFLIFVLLWAAFHRRWRLLFPFAMTLVILTAVSFFFFPNWFLPYLRAVFANLKFGDWLNPAVIFKSMLPFVGEKLGWVFSGLLAIVMLVEWWLARKMEFQRMLWTAALTLAITPMLGFPTYPQNYIILLISLVFSFSIISAWWESSAQAIIVGILVVLLAGLWLIAIYALNAKVALFFPLPLIAIGLLYWVRWRVFTQPYYRVV